MSPLGIFISGAVTMGFAVAALFFLRFWRRTRDGLFLAFAAAFVLLAMNAAATSILGAPREEQSPFFLLRIAAFVLIIAAIVAKNLGRSGDKRPPDRP